MSTSQTTKTTIEINTQLLRLAKQTAQAQGLTFTEFLNQQLQKTLKPIKKNPSLSKLLTSIDKLNLPKLTDDEIKSRYHTHLTKKYGQNLP